MRGIDFTSWQTIVSTLLGIAVVSLVAGGIRLLVRTGVQQRRERQNRQINERLKTLIAAYKVLGGSFTGDLAVDPRHLRDLRALDVAPAADEGGDGSPLPESGPEPGEAPGADRRRRVRDAVEAALADGLPLGPEEQVRLAARAADEMVAGRRIELAELVVSLRTFVRDVLDLEPVAADIAIPRQGPLRTAAGGKGAAAGRGEAARAGGLAAGPVALRASAQAPARA